MNMPEKFSERMRKMLLNEYEEFEKAFSEESKSSAVRVNLLKENAQENLKTEFGELTPVPWCDCGFYAPKNKISGNHPYHLCGLFYFQEASAMCAASAIPIDEGDYVLDLCAAPGGKATHCAQKLNGSGVLVANEINKKRAEILSENVERMGLKNVIVTNESPEALENKFEKFFDKIIVDAPCSGEGMFRKEPRAVTEWSEEHTVSCAARQKNILSSAMKMLRPGGMIVYSTCTFAEDENEDNVRFMLEQYPYLELSQMPELEMLTDGTIPKTKRVYPHKNRGEGHFAALFKDTREKEPKKLQNAKCGISKENAKLCSEFFEKYLNLKLEKDFLISFGDRIFAVPEGINIEKLKTPRPGLYLGDCKKGRFEPSHSLCLALKKEDFKNTVDFEPSDEGLNAYLKGNVIECGHSGWVCVTVSGYPIGWGKASGGILKNHYPKKYRLM